MIGPRARRGTAWAWLAASTGCARLDPIEVEVSELVPTVVDAHWDPGSPWWVEATELDGPDGQHRVTVSALADGDRVTVFGLAAGRTYRLEGVAARPSGSQVRSPPARVTLAAPPPEAGYTVEQLDPARSVVASGFLATGTIAIGSLKSVVMVIAGDGGLVWWVPQALDRSITAVAFGEERDSLVWGQFDARATTDAGEVVEVALDGSAETVMAIPGGHHVAVEAEPGTYAWLELEVRDEDRDGEVVHAGADRIVEGTVDGARTVVFDAFDDLYADGFTYPCDHAERAFDRYGVDDLTQWTHGNSLVPIDLDATGAPTAWLVFERWPDTLVKVDRGSRSVVWQLGGPDSDFTLADGGATYDTAYTPVLWSHGHFTDAWPGGLWMYDNGNHADPPRSRIVELAIDEAARTVSIARTIDAPDGAFTEILGDARRLPGGNVLAVWSGLGVIEEIAPDGEVVWRLTAPAGLMMARTRFFASWAAPD